MTFPSSPIRSLAGLLAVAVSACLAPPAVAQGGPPGAVCADILDVREGGVFRPPAEASFRLLDLWSVFEAKEPVAEMAYTPIHAFTTRPGLFRTINCNDDDNVVEVQEFYPVGTLVRPIMRLNLKRRSDEAPLILVLTEHGHRKVLPEADIQYLVSGATYIFAESSTNLVYCAADGGPEICPGNLFTLPDMGEGAEPGCRDPLCPRGYALGAKAGHAVAAVPTRSDAGLNAIGRVLKAQAEIEARGYLGVPPETRADLCRPIPVRGYREGRLYQPWIGPQREPGVRTRSEGLFLTLCGDRTTDAPPTLPPLRLVTKETAAARFAGLPDGAFYRRFAENNSTIATILEALFVREARGAADPRLTDQIECEEQLVSEDGVEAQVGGGLSLEGGIFSLAASVKRVSSWNTLNTRGKGEHLRVSAYIAPEFGGDPGKLRLLDLVFKADCRNSTVEKPASIVIQHPSFTDNHLDIGIQEMLINQYAADHDLVGLDNSLPLSRIEAGQFFEINNPQDYFFWRETLPRVLRRTTMSDYTATLSAEEADRVYEFFTHLLLAATFYYTDQDCAEGSC